MPWRTPSYDYYFMHGLYMLGSTCDIDIMHT